MANKTVSPDRGNCPQVQARECFQEGTHLAVVAGRVDVRVVINPFNHLIDINAHEDGCVRVPLA